MSASEIWKRKIIEIRSPRDSEESIESFEQALSSLATIHAPNIWQRWLLGRKIPTLSLELATINQVVHFFITTPAYYQSFVESQIIAQYPRLLLTETNDYLHLFKEEGALAFGRIGLSTSYYLPLRTYADFKNVDPLSTILGFMSKAAPGQRFLIQLILRPAGHHWQSNIHHMIERGITDPATKAVHAHPHARQMTTKAQKNGFKVGIRVAASAENYHEARHQLFSLAGSLGIFASGDGNQLHLLRTLPWQKKRLWNSMVHRTASVIQPYQYLNVAEIASIWHPPTTSVSGIRNIAWGRKYLGEPPENLPVAANLDENGKREINFFARTEYKNQSVTFGIKRPDRRRHMYIIGKTGTGKSTLIANMAINDMKNREGLAIIDPHGDLSNIVLDYIPSHRINDVVYLDPSDTQHPFSINPLEVKNPEQMELVASGFVAIFYKLYSHSWGPRLEYILRNCIMTLLMVPNATMVDIPPLLTDDAWRAQKVIPHLTDNTLRNFWLNEFDKMTDRLRSESISPILNKVGQFVSSPMIRGLIGQPKSTIDLEDIMNNGKILILNLSQGKLGEDNAALLGAMFITKMQLAAMNRVYLAEENRKDFYLYVDEFQNFATTSFIKILSEARKYRLNLILANQYIGQVLEDVQKAIFGNAGTLMAFIVGAADARMLTREFGDLYKESDLVALGNYQILLKLSIDNMMTMPFFSNTLPLPRSINKNREKVIRVSQERYTRKVKDVKDLKDQTLAPEPSTPTLIPTEN